MSKYDENSTMKIEQESIRQREQQRIEKDRNFEEKRLADERAKVEQKTQERLKKESEKRREKQRENKVAGKGNDIGTKTISIGEESIRGIGDSLKDIKRMREEMKETQMEKKVDYKTHEKQIQGKVQEYLKAQSNAKTQTIERAGR